ncbi:MAG TPA: 23S rRNA (adenine(2030)-N(6))-methyltransferase RlmJ [Xanthobacteraceae bacterium]|jgi:23S rRNA (adenine2030-N6)-methyltransferase
MNYRHAFHAGNFADVIKHATLVRILVHLRGKPAPFRVLDTHAGAGLYDLSGSEATRGGEWREGIARLLATDVAKPARALLAPYIETVASFTRPDELLAYPGSPVLARRFLRACDRLIACELEPNAAAALATNLKGDSRCKAIAIDGWTALKAYIPPKERRGLVLIDPAFEDAGDFRRLAESMESAHRKWAGGTCLLWYPIKERRAPEALAARLRRSRVPKILRAEICLPVSENPERLRSCGLIIVNPPWTLESELKLLLPQLLAALAQSDAGRWRLDWLAGE